MPNFLSKKIPKQTHKQKHQNKRYQFIIQRVIYQHLDALLANIVKINCAWVNHVFI